jgi:site-specific recombinase XerD
VDTSIIKKEQNQSCLIIPENKHFIEYFLELKAIKCKGTAKEYERNIKTFFKVNDVKEITLDDIRKVNIIDCENWVREMKIEGLSPNTINRRISALSSLYKWLLKYADNYTNFRLIFVNPFDALQDIRPKAVREKDTEFLTVSEVRKLLNSIKTDNVLELRNKTIIYILITTALRKSELINIKIKDIMTYNEYHVIKVIGKGNKPDFVKLQPEGLKLVNEYLEKTNRSMEQNKDEYLFVGHSSNNLNGKKLSSTALNQMVQAECKKANIKKHLTVHSLRHTAITLAILSGCSIEKVRDFARHSNISTTNIYIHSINKIKDNAGDYIAKLVG